MKFVLPLESAHAGEPSSLGAGARAGVLDAFQVRRFEEQGFLVVPGLLDPKAELAALDVAYQDLIETLALIHFAEAGVPAPPAFRERPLGERFALLQGASGGHAVEHLDPHLSAFSDSHRCLVVMSFV
jgi:hypothetical protein